MSRKFRENFFKYFKKLIQAFLLIIVLFNILYMTMCLSALILPLHYTVKGNKKALKESQMNYDLSIMKSDMTTLKNIDLKKTFEKYNIKDYSTFKVNKGLVIKDESSSFDAKIITVKDNINVLNTKDFKENAVNITKETADFKHIKNEDKLLIKLGKLNEKEYTVNTDFTLKHPKFVYDVALFIKDREKVNLDDINLSNIVYLNIDLKENEDKEKKLKEITDDIVKDNKNKGLLVYKNPSNKVDEGLKYIVNQFSVFYICSLFVLIILLSIYYLLEDKTEKNKKWALAFKIIGRILVYIWLIYIVILMPQIIVGIYKGTISYIGIYTSYRFILNSLLSALIFNILVFEIISKLTRDVIRKKKEKKDAYSGNIITLKEDNKTDKKKDIKK